MLAFMSVVFTAGNPPTILPTQKVQPAPEQPLSPPLMTIARLTKWAYLGDVRMEYEKKQQIKTDSANNAEPSHPFQSRQIQ